MSEIYKKVRLKAVEFALVEATMDTKEVALNNRGPRIDLYLRNAGALAKNASDDEKGLGWCGMFIYFCYDQAAKYYGMNLPFLSGKLWAGRKLRLWSMSYPDKVIKSGPLLPGDIYVIKDNHIGMVIESHSENNFVKTIDGNQSGTNPNKNSVSKGERSFHDMSLVIRI